MQSRFLQVTAPQGFFFFTVLLRVTHLEVHRCFSLQSRPAKVQRCMRRSSMHVCLYAGSSVITTKQTIPSSSSSSFLALGGFAGTTGVAFVSFASLESVLDESFFQDPQNPLANSRRKLKMNSRVVAGIMTGVKKGGFSDPVVYTVENIEVCGVSAGPPSAY